MGEITQAVMGQLKQFQAFLWLSVIVAVAGFLICRLLCNKIKMNSRRLSVLVLFHEMDYYIAIGFSMIYLKFMLIISTLLFFRGFPPSHYILLGLCSIFLAGILLNKDKALVTIVLNLLLCMGMGIVTLLRGYIIEVNTDLNYIFVFIFMSICIAAYSIYTALTELQMLMEEKRVAYENTDVEEVETEKEIIT